jgi:hypothetical protein
VVVAFALHSDRHTSFPAAVAVVTPAHTTRLSPLPIAVDLGPFGRTRTTRAVLVSRGGYAASRATSRDSGAVGYRRLAGVATSANRRAARSASVTTATTQRPRSAAGFATSTPQRPRHPS